MSPGESVELSAERPRANGKLWKHTCLEPQVWIAHMSTMTTCVHPMTFDCAAFTAVVCGLAIAML